MARTSPRRGVAPSAANHQWRHHIADGERCPRCRGQPRCYQHLVAVVLEGTRDGFSERHLSRVREARTRLDGGDAWPTNNRITSSAGEPSKTAAAEAHSKCQVCSNTALIRTARRRHCAARPSVAFGGLHGYERNRQLCWSTALIPCEVESSPIRAAPPGGGFPLAQSER